MGVTNERSILVNNKYKYRVVIGLGLIVASLSVFYLTTKAPELSPTPEGMRPWSVVFAESYFYPPSMISAYGENVEEGWTSGLLRAPAPGKNRFTTLLERMRFMLEDPSYDGFGMVLQGAVNGRARQTTTRLPSKIYIRWQSLYDFTVYNTVLSISEETRAKMQYPHPDDGIGKVQPSYQSTFVVGPFPDGRMKLWIFGHVGYTYIGEFAPEISESRNIPDNENPHFLKAKKEGVEFKPIPWDKTNKIYTSPNFQIN